MTLDQRKEAFATGYNQLVGRYGFVIQIVPRMLGGACLTELLAVPLDNWQPASSNGQEELEGMGVVLNPDDEDTPA